jgi:hypothetical protein
VALAALVAPTTGCDAFSAFTEDTSLLHLFTTHNGTPTDGNFPDHSGPTGERIFETDLGWTVTLNKAYVVVAGGRLESCEGGTVALDSYRGEVIEDLSEPDLGTQAVSSAEVPSGSYCLLDVEITPYGLADDAETPPDPIVSGASLVLVGTAQRGGAPVPFEVISSAAQTFSLDTSTMADGSMLRISGDEGFPTELLLSLRYDRFFDGVDFATADAASIESLVWERLTDAVHVSLGSVPYPG